MHIRNVLLDVTPLLPSTLRYLHKEGARYRHVGGAVPDKTWQSRVNWITDTLK